jgi:hypothetical protein
MSLEEQFMSKKKVMECPTNPKPQTSDDSAIPVGLVLKLETLAAKEDISFLTRLIELASNYPRFRDRASFSEAEAFVVTLLVEESFEAGTDLSFRVEPFA